MGHGWTGAFSIYGTSCSSDITDPFQVPMYLRNAVVAFVVYDISNRRSFNDLQSWLRGEISQKCSENVVALENGRTRELSLFILGNKSDLAARSREVSTDEGEEFAATHGARFFETSALSGDGIEAAINAVAAHLLQNVQTASRPNSQEPPSTINLETKTRPSKKKCC